MIFFFFFLFFFELELTKDSYLIGRHQDCDIKFQNDSISNRHCRVFMVSFLFSFSFLFFKKKIEK